MVESEWDVVVVGGGSAGLSAALTLVRARRRVLVLDDRTPRNRFSGHLHGLLAHDGESPLQLLAAGRDEVLRHGGVIRSSTVVGAYAGGGTVTVETDDGIGAGARRVLVATGLEDELPEIPGLRARWGSGVAVCPYCDGYEVRDQRIGILATSPGSVFQAQLLRQWSARIVYLENGTGIPEGDVRDAFTARGIALQRGRVAEVLSVGEALTGVRLATGEQVELDAIFTAPVPRPRDSVLRALGAARADTAVGSFVTVDEFGRTSVPGVWAAGNVVDPNANLAIAIGDAARAAGAINHGLVLDDIENAVRTSHVLAVGP